METYRFTFKPETAFASAIKGDTLFGQLCWMIREAWGEDRLDQLLEGYTEDSPFMVCSDAFPSGYILRPEYPGMCYDEVDVDPKQLKKRRWLSLDDLDKPVKSWLNLYRNDQEIAGDTLFHKSRQQHNSISRLTGTTGADFTPYQSPQTWYVPGLELDLWLLLDDTKFDEQELLQVMEMTGLVGYGRDATTGLGKFSVSSPHQEDLHRDANANTCITLAPAILSGRGFNKAQSYYSVFTRFGRHGGQAVPLGKPFKNPVLMADTAAVVVPEDMPSAPYIGCGLGGTGKLSRAIPETVQQGYAPCVMVYKEGLSDGC